jgi:hypothetical protein
MYRQHEGLTGLNRGITRVFVGFDDPDWPPVAPVESITVAAGAPPRPSGGDTDEVARLRADLAHANALIDRLTQLLLAHVAATGHSPMSLALAAGDHAAAAAELLGRPRRDR